MKHTKWSQLKELRKDLLESQKGLCLICERNISINEAVVDHHHVKKVKGSGLIRGVLCRTCNVLLGKNENNCVRYKVSQEDLPRILINMSKYLLKTPTEYIHPSETKKEDKLQVRSYNKLAKVMRKKSSKKIPGYPKTGKLTVKLKKLFEEFKIEPKFYKG